MLSIITPPESSALTVTDSHAQTLTPDEFESLPVVTQFKRSFSSGNRLGLLIGTVIGGFVPVASYELVHVETVTSPWMWGLVAGALIFSGLSVFQWASAAFASPWKGIGFVVLCEGSMVASRCGWLAFSALGILVLVNVASASCALQIGPDGAASSDTGIQSLGLQPSVTVSVQAVQQNVVTPARRASGASDAERKAADARRAREYRRRKRDAAAASSLTKESNER